MVTPKSSASATLWEFDDATRSLVRLSAIVTSKSDVEIRMSLFDSRDVIPPEWVEELLLQTHLFAGFPRALNAMREWRRVQPTAVVPPVSGDPTTWRADGEATCAAVYGAMYERLRANVRGLHPLLDDWMIVEGYGKVLSRPGLDLPRRELCIVAACAASHQDRQLHSHLHGAVNVGVELSVVDAAIEAIADLIGDEHTQSVRMLWARVRGK